MFTTCKPFILASASPRRQQFLHELGLEFTCLPANIEERALPNEQAADFACRMAKEKAEALAKQYPNSWILAADTVVVLDGQLIGKPEDSRHALTILRALQNRSHQVVTGLVLFCQDKNFLQLLAEQSEVTFAAFPDEVLLAYIQTGEPLDKAGAYGIQGKGAFLVQQIHGSCSNVIGLPLSTCVRLLLQQKIIVSKS
jgi:septum formation protein